MFLPQETHSLLVKTSAEGGVFRLFLISNPFYYSVFAELKKRSIYLLGDISLSQNYDHKQFDNCEFPLTYDSAKRKTAQSKFFQVWIFKWKAFPIKYDLKTAHLDDILKSRDNKYVQNETNVNAMREKHLWKILSLGLI